MKIKKSNLENRELAKVIKKEYRLHKDHQRKGDIRMPAAMPCKNKNRFNDRNSKFNPPRIVKMFFFMILLLVLFESRLNNSNTDSIRTKNDNKTKNVEKILNIEPSNKVGIIMNESINKIDKILGNINDATTSKQIDEYIIEVKKCNLSNDYTSYKKIVIQKLTYYKKFIETKDNKYIYLYNNTNVLKELANIFDKIGVEYTWMNESLHYNYKIN